MSFYMVDNQDKADFFASLTFDDVTATLAAGSDPNERDEDKVTPLHWIPDYSSCDFPGLIFSIVSRPCSLVPPQSLPIRLNRPTR